MQGNNVSCWPQSTSFSQSLMGVTTTAEALLAGCSASQLRQHWLHLDKLCVLVCMFDKLVWSYTGLCLGESFEALSVDFSELSPGFIQDPRSLCRVGPGLLRGSSELLSRQGMTFLWSVKKMLGKDPRPRSRKASMGCNLNSSAVHLRITQVPGLAQPLYLL